eukprot:5969328-Amphidinium_carterae.1
MSVAIAFRTGFRKMGLELDSLWVTAVIAQVKAVNAWHMCMLGAALQELAQRSARLEEALNQERQGYQGRAHAERKLHESLAHSRNTPKAGAAGTSSLEPTTRLIDIPTLRRPEKYDGSDADWSDWRFLTKAYIVAKPSQEWMSIIADYPKGNSHCNSSTHWFC